MFGKILSSFLSRSESTRLEDIADIRGSRAGAQADYVWTRGISSGCDTSLRTRHIARLRARLSSATLCYLSAGADHAQYFRKYIFGIASGHVGPTIGFPEEVRMDRRSKRPAVQGHGRPNDALEG